MFFCLIVLSSPCLFGVPPQRAAHHTTSTPPTSLSTARDTRYKQARNNLNCFNILEKQNAELAPVRNISTKIPPPLYSHGGGGTGVATVRTCVRTISYSSYHGRPPRPTTHTAIYMHTRHNMLKPIVPRGRGSTRCIFTSLT